MHEPVNQKPGLSDQVWQNMANQIEDHLNEEDVANPRGFAREAIGRYQVKLQN